MYRSLLACIFFVTLGACVQATPPPAPDTRAVDEQALREHDAAGLAAWTVKDADKVAGMYADDAMIVLPNAPIQGKDSFRSAIKGAFADPNFKLETKASSAEASRSGDLGYVRGTYSVTATDPKTKKAVVEKGNYLMVYKRQMDGSWKVINDFASPEAPAVPAETTPSR